MLILWDCTIEWMLYITELPGVTGVRLMHHQKGRQEYQTVHKVVRHPHSVMLPPVHTWS